MRQRIADRPWKVDKRSWIFYWEKMEEYSDVICEEIEGNIFLLDCETARLSIWSREWETFIDVGVSALISQVNRNGAWNRKEIFKETKIYYKGIELQNKCIGVDAGILEFIDIKGDLDRKYINISRKGFTEQGERFFEEQLYQGLLEAIHKVLRHLEKNGKIEKIKNIVERECQEKVDFPKLINLIVSVTILAYYAMREEWNISETLYELNKTEKYGWAKLLLDLDSILSKHEDILAELKKMTRFFNIEAYVRGSQLKEDRKGIKQYTFNFLQIFLQKNHWAIVQERKDNYGSWTDYLVMISSEGEQSWITEYKKIIKVPHMESDESILEEWGKELCEIRSSYLSNGDDGQQLILNWILKNVPTVGMFANKDGTIRVNILANKIYPTIYMNENFKFLLLRRMMEKAENDGIQSFSTIAWQGKELLACKRLPYSITFIKRGYLADYAYYKAIVPFNGKLWKQWKGILDKKRKKDTKMEKMFRLLDAMNIEEILSKGEQCKDALRHRLQQKSAGGLMNIATKVLDSVLTNIMKPDFDIENGIEDTVEAILEEPSKMVQQWRDIYYDIAWKYLRGESELLGSQTIGNIDEVKDIEGEPPGYFELSCMWVWCRKDVKELQKVVDEVETCYDKYTSTGTDCEKRKKLMIDYMVDKLQFATDKEVLQECVKNYEDELLELVKKMECQDLQQKVDAIKRKYSMFLLDLDKVCAGKQKINKEKEDGV